MAICWPSVGKELPPWFFTCAFIYFSAVLIVGVPYPFDVYDRMWNSIVPVPDYCLLSTLEANTCGVDRGVLTNDPEMKRLMLHR